VRTFEKTIVSFLNINLADIGETMKNKIAASLAILTCYASSAIAAPEHVATITVKNNMEKTVVLDTSMSPNLLWKLNINGAPDTPQISIKAHESARIELSNPQGTTGTNNKALTGEFRLLVTPDNNHSRNGRAQVGFEVGLNETGVFTLAGAENNKAYSNCDYSIYAVNLKTPEGFLGSDVLVDINPGLGESCY
jgi:hypothetical protein